MLLFQNDLTHQEIASKNVNLIQFSFANNKYILFLKTDARKLF